MPTSNRAIGAMPNEIARTAAWQASVERIAHRMPGGGMNVVDFGGELSVRSPARRAQVANASGQRPE